MGVPHPLVDWGRGRIWHPLLDGGYPILFWIVGVPHPLLEMGYPRPSCEQTDTCENSTLPILRMRAVIKW